MSEETFLICDGVNCAQAVTLEKAVEDGWWHGEWRQNSLEDGPADEFTSDLCPACIGMVFPDVKEGP